VSSQANSWLELRRGAFSWSGEHDIVYDEPVGLFPNVGASPTVEWRRDERGHLHALIFRVVAQNPADLARQVSRLFVVRLGQEKACVIGRVATNAAARSLADSSRSCSGPRP